MPSSAKPSKHPEAWILLSKIQGLSQITPRKSTCVASLVFPVPYLLNPTIIIDSASRFCDNIKLLRADQ